MRAESFGFLSFRPSIAAIMIGCGLLTPQAASAQYSTQVLLAPANLPQTTATRGFAINGSGQVFGETVAPGPSVQPVLWTNGVPLTLPLPAGYSWSPRAGDEFLNDNGTVVAAVAFASNAPGGVTNTIIRWRNGAYDFVPSPPPSQLSPSDCSTSYIHTYPMGLNNDDHVLVLATTGSGSCPWIVWIWDPTKNYPDSFLEIAPATVGPTLCSPIYIARLNGPHLNDADHVAIDFGPAGGPDPACLPLTMSAGVLADGTFTSRIPLPTFTSSEALNNSEQLLAADDSGVHFWDGNAVVDLGVIRGVSMNDFGEVLFSFGTTYIPRIYRNGATDDVPLPQQIPGFTIDPTISGTGGTVGINAGGQLLISMYFQDGGPFGTHTDHIVLFTPTTPTITWATPADITYGTRLGPSQLNAIATDPNTNASIPGTFVYTLPADTLLDAGNDQLLSVQFIPDALGYARTSDSVRINVNPATLVVTVDATPNPSVFGQTIQLTAVLDAAPSGAQTPTGSVEFFDGAASLGSAPLVDVNGVLTATLNTTLAVGLRTISGEYSGDLPHYAKTTSAAIQPSVGAASTTTVLTSAPNPSNVGQSVTLTATVAVVAPGQGTPTGAVQFFDGATLLGSANLNGAAVATLATSALASGPHSLTASYGGDGLNFTGSTSTQVPHDVSAPPTTRATATSLAVSANPIADGVGLTLTATVVQSSGAVRPAGLVTFYDGGVAIGSASLALVKGSMRASLITTTLTIGTHLLSATYAGNATFAGSASSPVGVTVYSGTKPIATSISLASSANPVTAGQTTALTGIVKTSGKTVASGGSVQFFSDGNPIGSASLVAGKSVSTATIAIVLPAGSHVIVAIYMGNSTFAASTSAPLTQVVQ
jgi:hypothetical protein